jgi:hypothetical protein
MPTLNYTTTIAPAKTIAEMQTALVKHGASSVVVRYENQRAVGLGFVLPTPHGDREFYLDVDPARVLALLTRQKQGNSRIKADADQAERVGWRVLKDWLLAQLAIIEAQLVELDQVMLPYLRVDADHTLYQAYKANEARALDAGS